MTDSVYRAKNWLMRADELEEQRKKQIQKIELIETRLNNCIVNYESTGARDPISARAAHEDLLADYASARAELEKITNKLIKEDTITRQALEPMSNHLYIALLIDKYISRRSIKEIAKSGDYKPNSEGQYSEAQLFRIHEKALKEFAEILEPPKLVIVPNQKRRFEHLEIILKSFA